MTQKRVKASALLATLAGVLLVGCSKKLASVTPPPPPLPPPAAPTATLAANPNVIQQGQATPLMWQTGDATEISIAGLGALPASGSRSVMPSASTTYTLVAKGPGGTKDSSARVTVNARIANAPPSPTDGDLFSKSMKDMFFDYDKSAVRADEVPAVQNDGVFLSQHPNVKVLIEGHCDDRGSVEYHLALGTSRAESVKRSLLQHGISRPLASGKKNPSAPRTTNSAGSRTGDHLVFER